MQLIGCLFLSYPVSSIFVRLPPIPAVRHIVNLAISAFYLLTVMQFWAGTLHMLGSIVATYYAVKLSGGKYPGLIFLGVMAHLVVMYAYQTSI